MGDAQVVTVFLGGDVMTGRGVDQILARPGDPRLDEPSTGDAGVYVQLAEAANGPIPRPVDDRWPWGDLLEVLDEQAVRVRLVNLETSITARGRPAPGKAVHYRMAPANVGCLAVARLAAVTLANNHVLDFGEDGLVDTLDTLADAGITATGAGRDAGQAALPAVVDGVAMLGLGVPDSGIPPQWTATPDRPGVRLVSDFSAQAVREILDNVPPTGVVVASVHWGANWGHDVPALHREFAHALIDAGVDIVHGHSSHHPRPVELYRGKLILYGCGDLINDYEGIGGYEQYRDDLRLAYLATVQRESGRLVHLRMVPLQARRMRLHRAGADDTKLLRRLLNRISIAPPVVVTADGLLEITPQDRTNRSEFRVFSEI